MKNKNTNRSIMCCLQGNPKKVYIILGLVGVAIIAVLVVNRPEPPAEIIALPIPDAEQKKIMKWDNPPEIIIDKNANYTAVIRTTKGDIEIELFAGENPITVNNFVFLAQEGFYNGIIFHRVIDGFMIQGGCPLGKGTGGPGYTIPDEFRPENRNNRGTISMANAGPNTGGSQFFINLVDNNFLDTRHPAFGKVVKGIDVVDAIGQAETGPRDRPQEEIVIKNIEIIYDK